MGQAVCGSTTNTPYNETYETKAKGQSISLSALISSSRALWKPPQGELMYEKRLLNREKEICSRLAPFREGQGGRKKLRQKTGSQLLWYCTEAILMG